MTMGRWHSLGASLQMAVLALAFAWIPQAQAADDFDSLYAAIVAANRNGSGSITLSQLISLGEPLPPIDSVIIIDGGGQTISGAWLYRIFDIDGGALTLKDLTLSAGKAPAGESGGLIRLRNGGSLVANNVRFQSGEASSGGAIASTGDSDRLTVNGGSFLSNAAENSGGAIYADGGAVRISGSAFQENTAFVSGGAIESRHGIVAISNSTIDNNEGGLGGAIHVSGGSTVLTHLTLSNNLAFNSGDSLNVSSGRLSLRNSIISGRGGGLDCVGELEQNAGNLITDGSCAPALRGSARLGALLGEPAYRRLLEDSPAINAALDEFCLATDQRGALRPLGEACDIGAFESEIGALPEPPEPPPACDLHFQILAANTDRAAGECPGGKRARCHCLDRGHQARAATCRRSPAGLRLTARDSASAARESSAFSMSRAATSPSIT